MNQVHIKKAVMATALLASLLGAGFAPRSEWVPKEFPISFWCGPPDNFITVERYKEIAAAGFNYVMPPCEGQATPERNKKILDTAKAAGLKAFVQDERMPVSMTGVPDAKEKLDAIIKDYSGQGAFAGYFITDEPGAPAFKGLGEVVAYLRSKDPKHPAYLNLFPNYANSQQLGTETYDSYVAHYIQEVQPFAVSYDHYHFFKDKDQTGYFANLDSVRTAAIKNELPFWQIVQAISFGNYRKLTEAEKRWEAMQTLAYGGKGLMYFTYWQPSDNSNDWGPSIVMKDGMLTPQYEEVKRINADVRALGKYLLDAVPSGVFQNGNIPADGKAREQGTPVVFPAGGDITVGLFRRDTHLYVLFANRDYKNNTKTDVFLSSGTNPVERLDKEKGRWVGIKAEKNLDGDVKVGLDLAPGDGELYRW
jgi:hypothetical protein